MSKSSFGAVGGGFGAFGLAPEAVVKDAAGVVVIDVVVEDAAMVVVQVVLMFSSWGACSDTSLLWPSSTTIGGSPVSVEEGFSFSMPSVLIFHFFLCMVPSDRGLTPGILTILTSTD